MLFFVTRGLSRALLSLSVLCVSKMPCPVTQRDAHPTRALTGDGLIGWLVD